MYLPWFSDYATNPGVCFGGDYGAFTGALQREGKEHTDIARLTCGRGLEKEVRDHAKVRGLLAHGGAGHGTSEPRGRETDCRGGRKGKEKNRKTEGKKLISAKRERRQKRLQ